MTSKDIRDIAAYWEATASIRFPAPINDAERHRVDWPFMQRLDKLTQDDIAVKLHLRPIASLTDEEMQTLASIHYSYTGNGYAHNQKHKRCISWTNEDRRSVELCIWDENELRVAIDFNDVNPIPYATYLQSIGVYVPGTIDEKYVQLIP